MLTLRAALISLFLLTSFLSTPAMAEHVITPKLSYISWDKNTFNLNGNQVTLDKDFTVLGFEISRIFKNGFSIGGEFLFHQRDVKFDSGGSRPGYANVYNSNAIAKYVFNHKSDIRPYIGAGLGLNRISVHSDTNAIVEGFSIYGLVGVSMYFSRVVGVSIGYKHGDISADDDYGNEIKTRTNTIQVGLDIRF